VPRRPSDRQALAHLDRLPPLAALYGARKLGISGMAALQEVTGGIVRGLPEERISPSPKETGTMILPRGRMNPRQGSGCWYRQRLRTGSELSHAQSLNRSVEARDVDFDVYILHNACENNARPALSSRSGWRSPTPRTGLSHGRPAALRIPQCHQLDSSQA
jgi:hypothetical protein